jgi:hypothetical protein
MHYYNKPGLPRRLWRYAEVVAWVVCGDGSMVPLLHPKGRWARHGWQLDRRLCKLGIKAFVRPRTGYDRVDSELPWLLVCEVRPGLRGRQPLQLYLDRNDVERN